MTPTVVSRTLAGLTLLDLAYFVVIFVSPGTWNRLFHGTSYVDRQGLLHRMGASWLAFAFFQGVALLRWREHPHWLALVAGIRSSELLSDWVLALFAERLTVGGRIGLLVASPFNILMTWFFLRGYRRFKGSPKTAVAHTSRRATASR